MHRPFLKCMEVLVGVVALLLGSGCASPAKGHRIPQTRITQPGTVQAGLASWYGEELRGEPMANGKPFNPDALTAASWFYPFGTRVRVSHAGRSVAVEITDRGPAERLVRQGRIIDLSQAAFARLEDLDRGLIEVRVKPVEKLKKPTHFPGRPLR